MPKTIYDENDNIDDLKINLDRAIEAEDTHFRDSRMVRKKIVRGA